MVDQRESGNLSSRGRWLETLRQQVPVTFKVYRGGRNDLKSRCTEMFFLQINIPTRITQASATCIDLVFTNIHNANITLQMTAKDYGFSDHVNLNKYSKTID